MRCDRCGTTVPSGESRCPECQAPVVGDPGNAPAGSDPPPPERRPRALWNALVWGVVVAAVVLVAVLAVMGM